MLYGRKNREYSVPIQAVRRMPIFDVSDLASLRKHHSDLFAGTLTPFRRRNSR